MKNHLLFVLGLVLAVPFMTACGSTATPRYEADAIVRDANLTATAIIDAAQAQVEADDIIGSANATATAIVGEVTGEAEVEDNVIELYQATAIAFVDQVNEETTVETTSELVETVAVEATVESVEATMEATEMVEATAVVATEMPRASLREVTPEVVAEATEMVEATAVVESTPEATEMVVEATEEATLEIVAEVTIEATEMVEATAVVESTPEATEMVVEATEEATQEAVVSVTEEAEATEAMDTQEQVIEPDFDPVPADEDPLQIVIELANPANGETLFNASYETTLGVWACTTCHNIDNDEVKIGPSLWGIPEWANLRVEGQGPYTYLYNSIHNSQAYLVPGYEEGAQMPIYGPPDDILSDAEIYDLVAYLMTLERPE